MPLHVMCTQSQQAELNLCCRLPVVAILVDGPVKIAFRLNVGIWIYKTNYRTSL